MKQLFIIRHGKATHKPMPDIQRFLTEKGIKQIHKLGKKLLEKEIIPDLIISSPATRAVQTAEILAETTNYPKNQILTTPDFYFMPDELVYQHIKEFPDSAKTVFITGHNPFWTDLADELSSEEIWHLRTGKCFGVAFETDNWREVFRVPRKDIILIN